ncbi:MAG: ferritin family protein [Anaerolineae bacterium]
MDEQITASAVISFCADWEDQAARFYETLAQRFPEHAGLFKTMANDCIKHKNLVQRTYQETVSDILETGYAFTDFKPQGYLVSLDNAQSESLAQAKVQAIALESSAVDFYQEVARRSKSLLATIPHAFLKVAAKRQERLAALRNL